MLWRHRPASPIGRRSVEWLGSRAEQAHRQHRRNATRKGHPFATEREVYDNRATQPRLLHRLELHAAAKEQQALDSHWFARRHLCPRLEISRRPVLDSHHEHVDLEGPRFQQRHHGFLRKAQKEIYGNHATKRLVCIKYRIEKRCSSQHMFESCIFSFF